MGVQIERSAQQGVIATHPLDYRLESVFDSGSLLAVSIFICRRYVLTRHCRIAYCISLLPYELRMNMLYRPPGRPAVTVATRESGMHSCLRITYVQQSA